MADIEIVTLDRIDGVAIVVGFSDGTLATYTCEELLRMRPERETQTDELNGT